MSAASSEGASSKARHLPLRGADLVLLGMQALWAPERITSNAVLVVECDGPIAPGRVQQAVERLLEVCPWPAARLGRPFPWGKLRWSAVSRGRAQVPVSHRTVTSAGEVHAAIETELNAAIDAWREPPVRVLLLEIEGDRSQGVLVLTWFHPLMDPRGGQNLLMHLAHVDDAQGRAPWPGAPPQFVPEPDRRPLRVRGPIARRSLDHMRALTSSPPVSPGTTLTTPGPARFRQEGFDDAGGPPRDICGRLAVVAKAMAGLWARRSLPLAPFLVPIAVDLRRKGDPGPTFGNMLAFHFARFAGDEAADVEALAQSLRRQLADAVRDGQIEANAVAMEFLHYRPVSSLLRELPGTARRETFSFNCADVADFPACAALFGRRVLNAYHVPAVLPRPGIGVFFNRCGVRNNLVASWVEGAVTEAEVVRILEDVREGMAWTTRA
jgi:hypothetical protein